MHSPNDLFLSANTTAVTTGSSSTDVRPANNGYLISNSGNGRSGGFSLSRTNSAASARVNRYDSFNSFNGLTQISPATTSGSGSGFGFGVDEGIPLFDLGFNDENDEFFPWEQGTNDPLR